MASRAFSHATPQKRRTLLQITCQWILNGFLPIPPELHQLEVKADFKIGPRPGLSREAETSEVKKSSDL